MRFWIKRKPFITILLLLITPLSQFNWPIYSYAQSFETLPTPGTVISLSQRFQPAIIEGITIHPDDPFRFDFIINPGDGQLQGEALKRESQKLIKYFLASLTVPEKEMWVNLSPYEKERVVPDGFGETEMGRDMLAQDYILKQLTASLMHPETDLGKEFWDKFYKEVKKQYGNVEVPVDTFNKVWIMPDKVAVYENKTSVFVVESHLKVMLEEDYLAVNKNAAISESKERDDKFKKISKEIMKEMLIPAIEKEVNEGKNFATIRQIFHSLILATWYKQNLKQSLLNQVYIDQHKTEGVQISDPQENHKIYEQYVEAFKKGVYNSIKEDYDPVTQEIVSHKYFSGGVTAEGVQEIRKGDFSMLARKLARSLLFAATVSLLSSGTPAIAQEKPISERVKNYFGRFVFNPRDLLDPKRRDEIIHNYKTSFDDSAEEGFSIKFRIVNPSDIPKQFPGVRGGPVPTFGIQWSPKVKQPTIDHPNDVSGKEDHSMLGTDKANPLGGIDFNPENLNINVQNKSDAIQFHFDPDKYKNMNINGLYPVIINMTPVTNIPLLLGQTSPTTNHQGS